MSISPINLALEELRQSATGDDKYFRRMLMFFEMKVPAEHAFAGTIDEFLFPIVIPPESYTLEEPFALEATPTQGGGLYVEENGIVQRMIKIRGTTGFKPRSFKGAAWILDKADPEKKSYTRALQFITGLDSLTGHGHIKYLQDCVFRTYADLKRDPASAEDTVLKFHIPKDDEHWLVAPQRFTIERSKERSTLYTYSIDLLVIDKADANDEDFSEDKGLIDTIKDAIRMVKTAIDLITGAINDLIAIVDEIKGFVKGIGTIIDSVLNIVDAAKNFVEGITDFIENPLGSVLVSNAAIDEAKSSYEALLEKSADEAAPESQVRDYVLEKLSTVQDGLERIASHPEVFESTSRRVARENAKRLDLFQRVSPDQIDEVLAGDSPGTLTDVDNLGTTLTPGDVTSAKGSLFTRKNVRGFKSAKEVSVTQGDTLSSLAAQHLGDARRWEEIAIVNGLKPPFVNDQASSDLVLSDEPVLPNVLGVGDKILIPSFAKAPQDRPLLPVLGAALTEPMEDQLLGRDFKLELSVSQSRPGKPLYDIPIDVEGGSVDAKTVAGVENLGQGLKNRLSTERGTDILYKRLGLRRLVGSNIAALDLESARLRIGQCILQDGRIGHVRRVMFEGIDGGAPEVPSSIGLDTLVVDIVAAVRGFGEGQRIRIAV